jgi:hypothetical protein
MIKKKTPVNMLRTSKMYHTTYEPPTANEMTSIDQVTPIKMNKLKMTRILSSYYIIKHKENSYEWMDGCLFFLVYEFTFVW